MAAVGWVSGAFAEAGEAVDGGQQARAAAGVKRATSANIKKASAFVLLCVLHAAAPSTRVGLVASEDAARAPPPPAARQGLLPLSPAVCESSWSWNERRRLSFERVTAVSGQLELKRLALLAARILTRGAPPRASASSVFAPGGYSPVALRRGESPWPCARNRGETMTELLPALGAAPPAALWITGLHSCVLTRKSSYPGSAKDGSSLWLMAHGPRQRLARATPS